MLRSGKLNIELGFDLPGVYSLKKGAIGIGNNDRSSNGHGLAGLSPRTDIRCTSAHVANVPISDIVELENAFLRMRKTTDLGELTAASFLLGRLVQLPSNLSGWSNQY